MSQLDLHLTNAAQGNQGGQPTGRPPFLQTGVVLGVQSPYALQVRLKVDHFLSDAELGWCYPLLTPGLLPEVGELVRVFLPDPSQPQAERYWIGPCFTGWEHFPHQSFPGREFLITNRSWAQIAGARAYPATDSRYPHFERLDRVHQLTRGRADAVYSPEGAFLRTARHEWGDPLAPNQHNPALVGVVADPSTKTSVALVHAERIALLSGPLPAADPLLPTAQEVAAAAAAAHPLAFADVLAEQLEVLRRALLEHLHPGPGKAGVHDESFRALIALDFSRLGSDKLVGN